MPSDHLPHLQQANLGGVRPTHRDRPEERSGERAVQLPAPEPREREEPEGAARPHPRSVTADRVAGRRRYSPFLLRKTATIALAWP